MKGKVVKDTTQMILGAGVRVFAEHGFAGARVDRIAELSGVNKAMIYYHYKNKEGLYREILSQFDEGLLAVIKSISEGEGDPLARINTLSRAIIDYFTRTDDDIKRIMVWELASGGKIMRELKIKNLILPMVPIVGALYDEARKKKQIGDFNPMAAHLMIVGTAIFTNIIRIVLNDTGVITRIVGKKGIDHIVDDVLKIFNEGIRRR